MFPNYKADVLLRHTLKNAVFPKCSLQSVMTRKERTYIKGLAQTTAIVIIQQTAAIIFIKRTLI